MEEEEEQEEELVTVARAWAVCLVLESDERAVTSARDGKGNVMASSRVKIAARSVSPEKVAPAVRGEGFYTLAFECWGLDEGAVILTGRGRRYRRHSQFALLSSRFTHSCGTYEPSRVFF